MQIFKDKNTELKRLLLTSRPAFTFDQNQIKHKILDKIEDQQITNAATHLEKIKHKSFFKQHQIAGLILGTLIFVIGSTVTTTQFNLSNPGSRLYKLDQLQEDLLFSIPIPESQKIYLQAKIVEERIKEMDYIANQQDQNELKLELVKKSEEELNNAITVTASARKSAAQQDKPEQIEKYNQALNKLSALAEEQEKKIELLRKSEKNEQTRKELDKYLEEVKQSRMRAKSE